MESIPRFGRFYLKWLDCQRLSRLGPRNGASRETRQRTWQLSLWSRINCVTVTATGTSQLWRGRQSSDTTCLHSTERLLKDWPGQRGQTVGDSQLSRNEPGLACGWTGVRLHEADEKHETAADRYHFEFSKTNIVSRHGRWRMRLGVAFPALDDCDWWRPRRPRQPQFTSSGFPPPPPQSYSDVPPSSGALAARVIYRKAFLSGKKGSCR